MRALSIVLLLAFGFTASLATAQPYPAKPIRLIVPFPPGGATDLSARVITQRMSAALGQPFVIENRAGAGGAIAEDAVAKSPADGYTLLYSVGSDMITRKFLSRSPTLDPLRDLTPIATAVMSVNAIASGVDAPFATFADLLDAARRQPNKLTYSSSGVTSYHHLIGELLKQNGIDMIHVPYKGSGPALAGLLGGQTDVAIINFGTITPAIKEGRLKALAVVEPRRYPGAPDVPSASEALPAFKAPPSWFGFFGPPTMPQPLVLRLNNEIKDALESSEVAARIRAANLNVLITPLERMRPFIVETGETFGAIVKAAGIQPSE